MKKVLFVFLIGTLSFQLVTAQPEPPKRDRGGERGNMAESLKIAFITKELNLSSSDAEKFWPVYNSYIAEIRNVKKENVQKQDPLLVEEQILNIRKKYKENFKKILGSEERANKLFGAENEYGKMVRKEWQDRVQRFRGDRGNYPPPPPPNEKDGNRNAPPPNN